MAKIAAVPKPAEPRETQRIDDIVADEVQDFAQEAPAPSWNPDFQSNPASAQKARSSASLCISFTAFPTDLDPSDLSYLHDHDALTLPDTALQIELLKAYCDFVHSQMPLLDLDLLSSITIYGKVTPNNTRTTLDAKPINLLLYQAVLYAGLAYVSTSALTTAGYSTRAAAQRIFSARVRLLYARNTCTDRLSIIQALLLMTVCASSASLDSGASSSRQEFDNSWHWLDLAILNSYMLELNRNDPQSDTSVPLKRRRLQRRIWWIAFLRERTLSFRSSFAGPSSKQQERQRPFRIKREDCQIDLLSLEDFDLDVTCLERGVGMDEVKIKTDATLFVESVLVCWCSEDEGPMEAVPVWRQSESLSHNPLAMSDAWSEFFNPPPAGAADGTVAGACGFACVDEQKEKQGHIWQEEPEPELSLESLMEIASDLGLSPDRDVFIMTPLPPSSPPDLPYTTVPTTVSTTVPTVLSTVFAGKDREINEPVMIYDDNDAAHVDLEGEYKDFMEYLTVGLAAQEREYKMTRSGGYSTQAQWREIQKREARGLHVLAGF